MYGQLVECETADGIRLDGFLHTPSDSARQAASEAGLQVDVMILHHGVGGNFYQGNLYNGLCEILLQYGCAVMQVNNRGHDLVHRAASRSRATPMNRGRMGAAYEDVLACSHDCRAWVEAALSRGYQRIGICGHSLGAVKSIYYMASDPHPHVTHLVALSPPRLAHEQLCAAPEDPSFAQNISLAERLVQDGQPDSLMEVTSPVPLLISARTFLQKYGPDSPCDYLPWLHQIRVPTLVVIGSMEAETVPAFRGMPDHLEHLQTELEHLTFASPLGADHVYTSCREQVWNLVTDWLA